MDRIFSALPGKISYMIETTLKERLLQALQKSGLSQHELARRCGVTHPTVNQWFSGNTKTLKADQALKVSKALNVDLVWLITGNGTTNQSCPKSTPQGVAPNVTVPLVLVTIGDNKKLVIYTQGDIPTIDLKQEWFDKNGINPKTCVAFKAQNDTMAPLIKHGDTVLIDTSNTSINPGSIYLIVTIHGAYFYRLEKTAAGDLLLKTDNPLYNDSLTPLQQDDLGLQIYGKAVLGLSQFI